MIKMKTVKKILICLLGCLMLGGGMGCLIRVGIGSDSLSCYILINVFLFFLDHGFFSSP